MNSEGQRLLAGLGVSNADIASACKATSQAVGRWKSGQRVPEPAMRRVIESAFGVPATAWETNDAKPASQPPATSEKISLAADDAVSTDRIEQLLELLQAARQARRVGGLATSELSKLLTAEGVLVERIARLEAVKRSEESSGDARIVRDNPWHRRCREAIAQALRKHGDKEVARDIYAALQSLEASP